MGDIGDRFQFASYATGMILRWPTVVVLSIGLGETFLALVVTVDGMQQFVHEVSFAEIENTDWWQLLRPLRVKVFEAAGVPMDEDA